MDRHNFLLHRKAAISRSTQFSPIGFLMPKRCIMPRETREQRATPGCSGTLSHLFHRKSYLNAYFNCENLGKEHHWIQIYQVLLWSFLSLIILSHRLAFVLTTSAWSTACYKLQCSALSAIFAQSLVRPDIIIPASAFLLVSFVSNWF